MRRVRSALVFIFAFTAISLVPIDAAVANQLGNQVLVPDTDFVAAGVGGMRGTGTGSISVSGVSGTVTQALLYWNGPTNSELATANATVTFDGNPVSGTQIGFSGDNCWGFANSQSYRADVTEFVEGNGDYALSDFRKTSGEIEPTTVADVNGASLIVFFDDGNDTNDRDVTIVDGNDSNIFWSESDPEGWDATIADIAYASGAANLQLHVSDGQSTVDGPVLIDDVGLVAQGGNFQGDSVPGVFGGNQAGVTGNLWDIRDHDITEFMNSPNTTLHLTSTQPTGVETFDCIALVAAIVDVPAAAEVITHTLTVDVTGDGGGTVTDGEGGQISCTGSGDPEFDDCVGDYEDGSTVELIAIPDETSTFFGWVGCDSAEGNFCSVTMNDERTVSAQFDPIVEEAQADLSIDKTDEPDPVTAGGALLYTLTVANAGPDDATNLVVVDTLPAETSFQSAEGEGWICDDSEGETGTLVTCTRDVLAAETTAPDIEILVLTSSSIEGESTQITNVAGVSADEIDPNLENNEVTETTTVQSQSTPDFASEFCPDGCTVTTDTGDGASPDDPTVTTVIVPDEADPQTVTITEAAAATMPTFCGGQTCSGQLVTITDITGVTNANDPIIVEITFDKTVKGGTQVYISDDGGLTSRLVANCKRTGVADPHPCVSSKSILANGDRMFTILLLSGDPILGKK